MCLATFLAPTSGETAMPSRRYVPFMAHRQVSQTRTAMCRMGIFMAVVLVLMASLVAASPRASAASDPSCPDYLFIGARGSGENPKNSANPSEYDGADLGMGKPVGELYRGLKARAEASGKTMGVAPLYYKAIDVQSPWITYKALTSNDSAYRGSVDGGVATALRLFYDRTVGGPDGCSTQLILGGYSQGAEVLAETLSTVPQRIKARVAATVFFGDPIFNPGDLKADQSSFSLTHTGIFGSRANKWSEVASSPVFSYCHYADVICNSVNSDFYIDLSYVQAYTQSKGLGISGQHENYVEEGDVSDAVAKVSKSLSLIPPPPTTPPSDLVFAIDSTGSMSDTLFSVSLNAADLAATIASTSSDARFALVDYKDYGDEYQSRVVVPFTTDVNVLKEGLGSLRASGGGDYPESMYSGVVEALALPWRDRVKKSVVVIGDAPGKDPEPGTGYTLRSVVRRAFEVDPAQVYTVSVSDDPDVKSFMSAISKDTGGTFTDGFDRSTFISSLKDALVQAGTSPNAVVTPGQERITDPTVQFSAKGTRFDLADPVVSYAWNFGDGTPFGSYDETTTSPYTTHEYAKPGDYTVAVSARTASGLTGLATAPVSIAPVPTEAPAAPTDVTATVDDGVAEITWRPGVGGGPVERFTIRDTAGNVLGGVISPPGEDQRLAIPSTAAAQVFLVASNAAGDSESVGPVAIGTTDPGTDPEPPTPPSGGAAPTLTSAASLTLTNQSATIGDGADVVVGGNFECTAASAVGGDLVVAGDVHLTNNCRVGGDVRAGGQVLVDSAAAVVGRVSAVGDVRVQSSARIGGDVNTAGRFVSIDGRTVDDLRAAGTLGGTVAEGADVTAPSPLPAAPMSAVDAGEPTLTWPRWMNAAATANDAPSWSPGRTDAPGCVMAPWGASVGGDTVSVGEATVIDARRTASGCDAVTLQQMRLRISGDLTVLADSIDTVGGLRVESDDGQPHQLRLLVPGEAFSCTDGGHVALSPGTVVDPLVTATVSAPGKVTLGGSLTMTGRVTAGCVESWGEVRLTAPAAAPRAAAGAA